MFKRVKRRRAPGGTSWHQPLRSVSIGEHLHTAVSSFLEVYAQPCAHGRLGWVGIRHSDS